ncbi:hypothetical protein L484_025999 [Morus notabilis]|uniref:Uncharacterized protein n=1 Tax=Morus notabilis TaxID=981085 RepID=W9R7S2_9ROSA|nr:hypothetical protein L484_025999 [Morus notabilis]
MVLAPPSHLYPLFLELVHSLGGPLLSHSIVCSSFRPVNGVDEGQQNSPRSKVDEKVPIERKEARKSSLLRENHRKGVNFVVDRHQGTIEVTEREGEITSPVRAGSLTNSTTALRKEVCAAKIGRGKQCRQASPKFLIASPSFHGGRGALPSAGGHPADLTSVAGGGC